MAAIGAFAIVRSPSAAIRTAVAMARVMTLSRRSAGTELEETRASASGKVAIISASASARARQSAHSDKAFYCACVSGSSNPSTYSSSNSWTC